ncbi:MAG TPA: DNA polymerase III subunit gamma/tau [Candidatus Saccharimonadales bacterium]|jgi:DNA polymerase-3 subunit gamma/tau|nr:DNA polymerase III subunit gamma/tau [Candidatus Saccharimonadales bacterium]
MSYQVLARKYRPQRFSEVIGQEHVTRTLKNAITQQRIAHGYIFSGHRGIGKTTIARILAMALNCRSAENPVAEPCGECVSCTEIRAGGAVDVIEIDAATNRGIDEIRELRDAARYRPARDRYKIYILDEAHQITDAAFNALLKTLEEPPPHIIFMMATTQAEDIPQTIRSRCQHFSFHAVKFDEIAGQLKTIAGQEGIEADDEAVAVLAEAGDGSMRDALSIMDQAIACCGAKLGAAQVRELVGSVGSEVMEDLMGTVARNSSEDAIRLLDRFMTEGHNPAYFARQLVRFLRNALVAKVSGADSPVLQVSSDERARLGRVGEKFSEEDLARFLQIMLRTYDDVGYRQEQRFHLELGVLKMVHAQRILPLEMVLSQVAAGSTVASTPVKSAATSMPRPVSAPAAPSRTPASSSASSASGRSSAPVAGERTASPFETDRARKSQLPEPEMSSKEALQVESRTHAATAVAVEDPEVTADPGKMLGCILTELEKGGHKMLVSTLEEGTVELVGSELRIAISQSKGVIELLMQAEQKRIACAAASRAAGTAIKVEVVSGTVASGKTKSGPAPARAQREAGGARGRAANEPVVQRMREKFGAEIRTVIDHHEKN